MNGLSKVYGSNPVASAAVIPDLAFQLLLCVRRVPFCRETEFNADTGNGTMVYDSPLGHLGPFRFAVFSTKVRNRCDKYSNRLSHNLEHHFAISFAHHICCLRLP